MYKTLANIFISFLGAGILTLPYAFRMSGLLLGGGFLAVLALLAYYCILLLVDCKKAVEHKAVVCPLPLLRSHYDRVPSVPLHRFSSYACSISGREFTAVLLGVKIFAVP